MGWVNDFYRLNTPATPSESKLYVCVCSDCHVSYAMYVFTNHSQGPVLLATVVIPVKLSNIYSI